jgi:hypothetical protein
MKINCLDREILGAVLDTRPVTVYTKDGEVHVGEFRNYATNYDTFTLEDREGGLTYKEEIPFDSVLRIRID